MPRDEAFSEIKNSTFTAKTVYSVLHAVLPSVEGALIDCDLSFPFFTDIRELYNEGITLPKLQEKGLSDVIPRLLKSVEDATESVLRFETPEAMLRKRRNLLTREYPE